MAKNKTEKLSITQTGFQSPAGDYVEKRIDLNAQLIESPSSTFFLRSDSTVHFQGDVYKGDVFVVDRSKEPANGDLLIAVIDGELVLRRLEVRNGKQRLVDAQGNGLESPSESNEDVCWGVVTFVIHAARKGSVA